MLADKPPCVGDTAFRDCDIDTVNTTATWDSFDYDARANISLGSNPSKGALVDLDVTFFSSHFCALQWSVGLAWSLRSLVKLDFDGTCRSIILYPRTWGHGKGSQEGLWMWGVSWNLNNITHRGCTAVRLHTSYKSSLCVEIWHWFIYIGGGGYKLGDDLTLAFTSLALAVATAVARAPAAGVIHRDFGVHGVCLS